MNTARFTRSALLALALAAPAWSQLTEPAPADPKARQEMIERQIAVLKSDAPHYDKFGACRQLGAMGAREAVPLLAGMLTDEKLSHMARYGLETIADPSVDAAFRDALGTTRGKTLAGILMSVGFRRDAEAVDAVAPRLSDPDADVASCAASALGRIATPKAIAALVKGLDAASGASLAVVGEGCLIGADALLGQGRRDEAAALYERVRRTQAPRHVRMAALRGLLAARGGAGIPLLAENLKGEDWGMFTVALKVASEMPGPEVMQALTAELGKLAPERQVLLIQALGQRADKAAAPALLACAKSGTRELRIAALRSLAQIGAPSVLPSLVEMASCAEKEIAEAARYSLATFPGEEADAAVAAMPASPDANVRGIGIGLIGQRRMTGALPVVRKAAADDPEGNLRVAAIRTLGELGDVEDLSFLAGILLGDKTAQDARAAEAAMAALCVRRADAGACADRLTVALPKAKPGGKCALLRVLRSVADAKALGAVRAAASDADAEVQNAAVRVLCDWPTADAAPDLLALARGSPSETHKLLGLRGYLRLCADKDLAADRRLAMSREAAALVQRDEERKMLLGVLSAAADADSLGLVARHLDTPAIKEEACGAAVAIAERLHKQDPAAVVPVMEKVLQLAPQGDIGRRAQAVLGQARKSAP